MGVWDCRCSRQDHNYPINLNSLTVKMEFQVWECRTADVKMEFQVWECRTADVPGRIIVTPQT